LLNQSYLFHQMQEVPLKKIIIGLFGLVVAVGIFGMGLSADAADRKIKLRDLAPKYNTKPQSDSQRLQNYKAPPKPKSTYQRFDSKVRKMRKSDGVGVGYSSKHKTPTVTYKKSFK